MTDGSSAGWTPSAKTRRREAERERFAAKARATFARELAEAAAKARLEARAGFLEDPGLRLLATPMPQWTLHAVHWLLILLILACIVGTVYFVSVLDLGAAALCAGLAIAFWIGELVLAGWR